MGWGRGSRASTWPKSKRLSTWSSRLSAWSSRPSCGRSRGCSSRLPTMDEGCGRSACSSSLTELKLASAWLGVGVRGSGSGFGIGLGFSAISPLYLRCISPISRARLECRGERHHIEPVARLATGVITSDSQPGVRSRGALVARLSRGDNQLLARLARGKLGTLLGLGLRLGLG